MICTPLSQMINLCRHEPHAVSAHESVAEKNQKFAEEATFFISLFKHRTVKPMPDIGLMMVLQKDKTRRGKHKIAKKQKPQRLYFNRKQHQQGDAEYNDSGGQT